MPLDFQEHMARQRRRRYARYLYATRTVPENAEGVALRDGKRWWYVTPAFPYDAGRWRISYGDEHGPSGHYSSTGVGDKPFVTKYDAMLDVLTSYPKARIQEYVLPDIGPVLVER